MRITKRGECRLGYRGVMPPAEIAGGERSTLVSGGTREMRSLLLESAMDRHATAHPVVYLHQGNDTMCAWLAQCSLRCFHLNATTPDCDPLTGLDVRQFVSRMLDDPAMRRYQEMGVSEDYLDGLMDMLRRDGFQPTLYRLSVYAARNMGRELDRMESVMSEEEFDQLRSRLDAGDQTARATRLFLRALVSDCGRVNRGAASRGQSIARALNEGRSASVDLNSMASPMRQAQAAAQIRLMRERGVDFGLLVDLDCAPPAAMGAFLEELLPVTDAMFFRDVWTDAEYPGRAAGTLPALSHARRIVFMPGGNQSASDKWSGFMNTYWRTMVSTNDSHTRGSAREAFHVLPTFTSGHTTGTVSALQRDAILDAGELQSLPEDVCLMVDRSMPARIAVGRPLW